ncbi:protein of unknown function; putative exported protein [Methylorubrum extorquens]|uniref:Uncharacterized protein n=1 Tax=Methylorubrum extorquens TaxID=408 RepID=A0A2N9ANP6_METEX|nr:hypothetical protein [Methylorubrum zatmanii]ARO56960.1 hypothetical protein B2G69_24215 [Methylorubrum zatmanii]KQQ15487.1 hypothetical protein ASF59_16935 [Methylobacterium sp. Leaf121]SOR28987.1 protein of unknown function; putative exported protein [Methylorubrum extorquens]
MTGKRRGLLTRRQTAALCAGAALAGFVAGPASADEGQMRVAKPFGIVYLLRNVIEVSSLLSSRALKSKTTHFGSRSSL